MVCLQYRKRFRGRVVITKPPTKKRLVIQSESPRTFLEISETFKAEIISRDRLPATKLADPIVPSYLVPKPRAKRHNAPTLFQTSSITKKRHPISLLL